MTSWDDVRHYLADTYDVLHADPCHLVVLFAFNDGRTQEVLLDHKRIAGDDWVAIETPVGLHAQVDLDAALDVVGDAVCGGLALNGEHVVLRHAVPLTEAAARSFDLPLAMVMLTAAELERRLRWTATYH